MVMATHYGRKARRVLASDINAITLVNSSILLQSDINGGAEIQIQHAGNACITTSSFYIELKDTIAWTNITCEFNLTSKASCWGFNTASYSSIGNLLAFNPVIDTISRSVNCFELPQFSKVMTACDNATGNMYHNSFAVGTYRSFFVSRRRNVGVGLAGISHGLSCIGVNGITTVRNIYIW
jgi:hypothetical protein